jgi:hypothetical protein
MIRKAYHWMGLNNTTARWNNEGYSLQKALKLDTNIEIRIIDTIEEMCDLLRNWK